jgi:hypothetical protein
LIGITPQVPLQPTGYSSFDGVEMDAKGNIYVSEIVRNEIWVLSPDGSQRILIANKMNAPLDNNTSLVEGSPRRQIAPRLHEGLHRAEIAAILGASSSCSTGELCRAEL